MFDFFMKLGDYKSRKVTEPDIWRKLLICRFSWKCLQKSQKSDTLIFGCWLVGKTVFSETALRIFLIFCIKLRDYKDRKVTEPDFWKKYLIWRYSQKQIQISPKSDTLTFGWWVGWLVTQFSHKLLQDQWSKNYK